MIDKAKELAKKEGLFGKTTFINGALPTLLCLIN